VTAALLHDACRAWDNETLLARAREYALPISPAQHAKPNLLHGPVAAEEARRDLAIDDPDIYEAIYWHTTGRPGMGRLAQALYVADFSEPNRKYPEAAIARHLLQEQGLDAALRYVAEQKSGHLAKKEIVDPATAEFLAWLRAH
jgi:predicted HD superfamily hydrolase involved in NAD metabolism